MSNPQADTTQVDTKEEPRYSSSVSYRKIPGWGNRFATNIHGLMAPSRGGVKFPHLHRVFRDRAREGEIYGELSRCDCYLDVPMQGPARTDSGDYQNHVRADTNREEAAKDMQHHGYALQSMCPRIHERLEIYGCIGSGSMSFSLRYASLLCAVASG